MYEPVGTVDHFVSVDEDRLESYDWTNYRLRRGLDQLEQAGAEVPRRSSIRSPSSMVVRVLLAVAAARPHERVPPEERERAQRVLTRLHLGHDERVVRQRREWYRMYQEGELDLDRA